MKCSLASLVLLSLGMLSSPAWSQEGETLIVTNITGNGPACGYFNKGGKARASIIRNQELENRRTISLRKKYTPGDPRIRESFFEMKVDDHTSSDGRTAMAHCTYDFTIAATDKDRKFKMTLRGIDQEFTWTRPSEALSGTLSSSIIQGGYPDTYRSFSTAIKYESAGRFYAQENYQPGFFQTACRNSHDIVLNYDVTVEGITSKDKGQDNHIGLPSFGKLDVSIEDCED